MSSRRVSPGPQVQALHDVEVTRSIETRGLATLEPNALMTEAGLAIAKLTMALAPHARHVWVACGPGNNGGDGMAAALALHRRGKQVSLTLCTPSHQLPGDAAWALRQTQDAGLAIGNAPPEGADFCVDALLGIGARQAPRGDLAEKIRQINAAGLPVLAVDTPSGLCVNTGVASQPCVSANWTLSLLTLKPGLFTADGRDVCGEVWLDDLTLGSITRNSPAQAWLAANAFSTRRLHASHKGSFGDVAVLGGANGMAGAALLAASAALHGGAGRVYVGLLDTGIPLLYPDLPELMLRRAEDLNLHASTVVCGCGGSGAIETYLPEILSSPRPVVLDADALNAVARTPELKKALRQRAQQDAPTVITPHPLEAARLLGTTTKEVQSDRLSAGLELAGQLCSTVILKGSGTIVVERGKLPVINPTGNPRLATAGSGDVLAGMVGAWLAQGSSAFDASCRAVFQHGLIADQWPSGECLTASSLARALSL